MTAHDQNDDSDDLAQLELRAALDRKLVMLGALAAGANHELSGPIHRLGHTLLRVEGMIAKLGIERERTSPIASELANARRDIQRMDILSRAMKAVVQPSEGATRMRVAIDDAIALVTPAVADRAQLETSIKGEPTTLADRSSVVMILVHLITNAAQAIAAGDPESNAILVETFTTGHDVAIEVFDTGHGIPDALRARIFDPHYSTRSARTNSGMGLAIVLSIIRALQGDITVRANEPRGSVFCVTLPAQTLSSVRAK